MLKCLGRKSIALLLAVLLVFAVLPAETGFVFAEEQMQEAAPAEEKKAEAPKEEKKAEEPKKEEPKKEEPKKEEVKQEAPKEEPKKEEPKQEEPKKEEPKQEESKKEETPKEESKPEAPAETKAPEATKKPEATPIPTPTPTPTPTPEVTPAPETVPESKPDAPAEPDAGAEATAAPEKTAEPEKNPENTPAPEGEPEPLPTLSATDEPDAPAAEPEESIVPELTIEPTVTPEPSPTPTPAPPSFKLLDRSKSYANNHLNPGDLDIPGNGMPIPLIYQYNYTRHVCEVDGDGKSVASSGCGAAAASMIIAYVCQEYDQTPYTLFYWAAKNGRYHGDGLSYDGVRRLLSRYGVDNSLVGVSADNIINALRDNCPIIINMGAGTFTKGGHYIVLRGLDSNGNVLVNDPNSSSRSRNAYSVDLIVNEAKRGQMIVVYGGPGAAECKDAVEELLELEEETNAVSEEQQDVAQPEEITEPAAADPEEDIAAEVEPESAAVFELETEPETDAEPVDPEETAAEEETDAAAAEPVQEAVSEYTAAPEPAAEPAAAVFSGSYAAVLNCASAKLRTAPAVGEVMAIVHEGTQFCVVDEQTTASGALWCGVAMDGQTLYLRADYLTRMDVSGDELDALCEAPLMPEAEAEPAAVPAPAAADEAAPVPGEEQAPEAPLGETEDGIFEKVYLAEVNAKRVNLRQEPGEDALIISSVPKGTALCIVGEELCDDDGRVWCAVMYQKQKLYMRGDMLTAMY